MIEADVISSEGNFPKALEIIDALIKISDPEDGIPLVIKANIFTRKAMEDLQVDPSNQQLLLKFKQEIKDIEQIYEKSIEIEPNGVEALSQYASVKTMFCEDFIGGQKLVKSALENARTRDEVQELSQLLLLTTSQLNAMSLLGICR
jgi:hypothetical protein